MLGMLVQYCRRARRAAGATGRPHGGLAPVGPAVRRVAGAGPDRPAPPDRHRPHGTGSITHGPSCSARILLRGEGVSFQRVNLTQP